MSEAQDDTHVGGVGQKTMLTVVIFFIVQAIIGICAIEYAFRKVRRTYDVDEDRDS